MRLGYGVLSVVVVVAACGGGGGGGTTGGGGGVTNPGNPVLTNQVEMRNTAFNPDLIQVAPGSNVTFTNNDGILHNVTFSSAAINSIGSFSTGSASTVMPATPGTYDYHCTLHAGMAGSIKVQ